MACAVCFGPVEGKQLENFESVLEEILDVLQIKKYFPKEPCKNCKACTEKIKTAFNFKSQCLITEDLLYPYINGNTERKTINLIEVYNKENNQNVDIGKHNICRLCMDIVYKDSASSLQTSLNKYNLTVTFKEYFQELNVEATNNSIVCDQCIENLQKFANFIGILENNKLQNRVCEAEYSPVESSIPAVRSIENTSKPQSKLKCSQCNYITNQPKNLAIHKAHHVDRISCNKCSYSTKSKTRFKEHGIKKHNSSEVFQCDICNFSTQNESSYRNHHKLHTNKPIKCPFCKVKVSRQDMLKKHIKFIHGNPEKLNCHICPFTTVYIKSLKLHLLAHTKEKPFACKECEYRTHRKDILKNHAMVHQNKKGMRMFKCKQCSYETNYKHSLLMHFVSHTQAGKTFRCAICDLEFKYVRDHKAHMKEAHEGKGLYKCDDCPFESINRDSLNNHVKVKHLSARKFLCEKCESKFSCKFALENHVKRCHNDCEIYSCEKCDFKTKVLRILTKHTIFKHDGFDSSIKVTN